MFYTVLEIQSISGTKSCIPVIYSDDDYNGDAKPQAMSKYHEILYYAAVSTIEYHGALIVDNNGTVIAEEHYDRRGV